jgi:N-acetylneuraminate lyase
LAGYKFTDMNLIELEGLVEDGLCVLNGHDPNLSAALMLGASGGIGSYFNLVPREAVEIYRASLAGDWRRARVAQRQMNRVIASGRKHRLIPALKFLCSLNGPSVGAVREPLLALTADEQRDLEKELEWLLCSH